MENTVHSTLIKVFIRKKYINDEGFKHVKQESGFSIYDTKDKFEDYEYITSV